MNISNVNTDIKWEAGAPGVIDKAKHFATLFIEEIGDFIQANVDEFFSFTKYDARINSSLVKLSSNINRIASIDMFFLSLHTI